MRRRFVGGALHLADERSGGRLYVAYGLACAAGHFRELIGPEEQQRRGPYEQHISR